MSLEAIKTIGEAEENAKRIRADAASDAKKAIADAEAAGHAAIDAAIRKAEDELRELTKKADEKATADAQQLADDTENKKAAMRARAEKLVDKAASLVVERIVNS
jgi:vacuolar-type H+-ATPase subunit H